MKTETKREVFDETLSNLKKMDAQIEGEWGYSQLTMGVGKHGDVESIREIAIAEIRARYAAALPDDLPVVSKEVSNIMRAYYFLWWKEFLDKAYDNELDKELSDDDDINYKVRSESAEVARALILGVWRVEGTGEIVKLEAEVRDEKA